MIAYVYVRSGPLLGKLLWFGSKADARWAARELRRQGVSVMRTTRTGII